MMARSETLQSKAGYMMQDHYPRIDEILLRRTAGPYMWAKGEILIASTCFPLFTH